MDVRTSAFDIKSWEINGLNESDLNENRSMEALSLKMAKTVELKEITWDLHVIR